MDVKTLKKILAYYVDDLPVMGFRNDESWQFIREVKIVIHETNDGRKEGRLALVMS